MYQIYADDTLIYDSTIDDYKIGKGQITKEVDKSGSFVFSLYPDHFYYDRFVKLKTVVMVKKSGKVAFRGRVLNDVTDYWNRGDFTCEGELGFLQDSVVRPFEFMGSPADLFKKFIEEHNAQVDEFKRFKVGTVTVVDANNYINRSTGEYPTTLEALTSALTGSDLGGHIYITHGDDGTEEMPTIHYVADFPKTATQAIEFGVNLKNYTRTTKAEDVATAVIPLGTQTGSDGSRLTIADVNDGVDYLYDEEAVALRGWVFKTVVWDDVTLASNLKTKGQAWLDHAVNQAVTIELTAVDMHLLDRSIESYNVCEYVHATSKPHGFDAVMLCNKQTMDLLQPDNDTVTLGYQTSTFTGASTQMAASVSALGKKYSSIKQDTDKIALEVVDLNTGLSHTLQVTDDAGTVATGTKTWRAADYTADDLTLLYELYFSGEATAEQLDKYDFNMNGRIDSGDAIVLQTMLNTGLDTVSTWKCQIVPANDRAVLRVWQERTVGDGTSEHVVFLVSAGGVTQVQALHSAGDMTVGEDDEVVCHAGNTGLSDNLLTDSVSPSSTSLSASYPAGTSGFWVAGYPIRGSSLAGTFVPMTLCDGSTQFQFADEGNFVSFTLDTNEDTNTVTLTYASGSNTTCEINHLYAFYYGGK